MAVEIGGQVMVLAETTREWIRRRQERAMARAVAKAREEGRAEGRELGRAEGRELGRAEGREEGRELGRAEARAEILRLVRDSHPDLVIPDLPPIPGASGQENVP